MESSAGGKKIINVSIDLIRDGLSAGGAPQANDEAASYIDDSNEEQHQNHWNIVESLSNNNLSQELKPTKQPKKSQNIFSGSSDPASKKDKYKKMFAKYDNTSRVEGQSHLNSNNTKSNHQRKYTFDAAILGSSPNSNGHSPLSHSPMQAPPKNRLSVNHG